jgi:glycosyltransferase involved in cell wall biosynthesis
MGKLKIALVHDWLTGMRGGEKCLEVFGELWPNADLFTLLAVPEKLSPALRRLQLHTSFLQPIPGIARWYRHFLPLMPAAIERLRLPAVDAVLSSSHCVAKSIPVPPGVPHLCYCHTPMRYAWHMREAYVAGMKPYLRPLVRLLLDWLRSWDRRTSQRVTHFIANSETVRQRIREAYRRESVVIHPPVDTLFYHLSVKPREDYCLTVSALVPYKRLDLAIEACNRLGKKLVIIGTGEMEGKLRAMAGPKVHFLGWGSNEMIRDHLQRCRVLLFPGEEDFGIVPVEANACGTPVIAFGRGGATETIVPSCSSLPFQGGAGGVISREPTGIWFDEQTTDALVAAMQELEAHRSDFSPSGCRRQAVRFCRERFAAEIAGYVQQVTEGKSADLPVRRAA